MNIWSVTNFFNGANYTKYASNITHTHSHDFDFDWPFTHSQSHKHVKNFSISHSHFHPSVDNDLCTNGFQINYRLSNYTLGIKNWCRECTPVHSEETTSDNSSSSNWQFECLEKDPLWGFVTLVTMFFPGFFGLQQIAEGKGDLFNAVVVLAFPFFPLVLIAMKILLLFNPGPNWKIFSKRFGLLEGRLGCQYQLGLQLFILLIRADRDLQASSN